MSILIGLYIKKALEGYEPLMEMTQGRICPVVFPEVGNTPAPYVTFVRTSYGEESTKDGQYGDTCGVDITCVARSYEELLILSQAVCDALHEDMRNRGGNFEDMPFVVTDMDITAGGEDFDPNTCEFLTGIHVDMETEAHAAVPDNPKVDVFAMGFPFTVYCGGETDPDEPDNPNVDVFAMGFPFTVYCGGEPEHNDLPLTLAANIGG